MKCSLLALLAATFVGFVFLAGQGAAIGLDKYGSKKTDAVQAKISQKALRDSQRALEDLDWQAHEIADKYPQLPKREFGFSQTTPKDMDSRLSAAAKIKRLVDEQPGDAK